MEDISSMLKYCICFIAAIGILVLLYRLLYVVDGFYGNGCPEGSVWNDSAKACRDPNCKPGQRNTRGPSGMICDNLTLSTFTPKSQEDCPSGTTFDKIGKTCNVCTKLPNGTTECRSQGAYDVNSSFVQGSINPETVRTDILTTPGEIDYRDWVDDPKTSYDLRGSGDSSSFLGSQYIDTPAKLITESVSNKGYDTLEDDYNNLLSRRKISYTDNYEGDYEDDYQDNYDLTSERNITYDFNNDENSPEEAYIKLKNNRKTVQELINDVKKPAEYRKSKVYGRYTERPCEMLYANNADPCNDDCSEGFAARL